METKDGQQEGEGPLKSRCDPLAHMRRAKNKIAGRVLGNLDFWRIL